MRSTLAVLLYGTKISYATPNGLRKSDNIYILYIFDIIHHLEDIPLETAARLGPIVLWSILKLTIFCRKFLCWDKKAVIVPWVMLAVALVAVLWTHCRDSVEVRFLCYHIKCIGNPLIITIWVYKSSSNYYNKAQREGWRWLCGHVVFSLNRDSKEGFDRSGPGRHSEKFGRRAEGGDRWVDYYYFLLIIF